MTKEQLGRFWDKVVVRKKDECWLWLGAKINKYGSFRVNDKTQLAHRISWLIHNGDIPSGMIICHKCDNPPCVNPYHLLCGTHQDNMQDSISKGRSGGLFKRFSIPPNRILTNQQARIIRKKILNRGKQTLQQLAGELGFKTSLLADISMGRSYRNI